MDPKPRINEAPEYAPHLRLVRRKNDKQEDKGQSKSGKGQKTVGQESGGQGLSTLPAALGLLDTPSPLPPPPPTSSILSTTVAAPSVTITPSSTLQPFTISPPQSAISAPATTSDSVQTGLAVGISYEFSTTTLQSVPYQTSFSRQSFESATTADNSESVFASETPTQSGSVFVPTRSVSPSQNNPNPERVAAIAAGIATGTLGSLMIIAAIVFLFFRRRRRGDHAASIPSRLSNLSRRFGHSVRRDSISRPLTSGADAGLSNKEWDFKSTFAQPMPLQSLRSPNEPPDPFALNPVKSLSTPSILSIRKSFAAVVSRFSFSTLTSSSETPSQLPSHVVTPQTLPDPATRPLPTPLQAPQPTRFQTCATILRQQAITPPSAIYPVSMALSESRMRSGDADFHAGILPPVFPVSALSENLFHAPRH
ncbi:hypothetical protein K469DRAFT_685397 [Zopfia rhizophila CBS 207.26]|uniref:Uncharacterized protein n=1 Tax=Zopfia rhizophila CBS 207.26 TaxID=1314779 RepID=A0A6A6D8J2_9PEZI|nr:hypothetical protein K469DRAFT_685397 [Zopfia rhizophila CBS 207.26]